MSKSCPVDYFSPNFLRARQSLRVCGHGNIVLPAVFPEERTMQPHTEALETPAKEAEARVCGGVSYYDGTVCQTFSCVQICTDLWDVYNHCFQTIVVGDTVSFEIPRPNYSSQRRVVGWLEGNPQKRGGPHGSGQGLIETVFKRKLLQFCWPRCHPYGHC